jgi:hypothetical protein
MSTSSSLTTSLADHFCVATVPFRPLVRRMLRPFFFDPGFERYWLIGEHRRSTASGKPRVSEPTVEKVQYLLINM